MLLKTRFCPSPTGYIHLGNVRTALFSALFAKNGKGVFLLRIEDTDKTRSDETYTQALMRDLRWLSLNWDEGADAKGDNGPYYQSERQAVYDRYYDTLVEKKLAYPCFCTEEQLTLQRALQKKAGKPPRYAGTCRHLTPAQREEKMAAGLKPTLRFSIPDTEVIQFEDLVRGLQSFKGSDLGDFIIRRADGTAPFMYCNAIDDALMGVTHVLRGEDHLTNTPRQLAILKALDLPEPSYGHITLIVGADGSPLSKRHGSRSIHVLREEGFLPLAIVNYLARLGHYYGHDNFLTVDRLAAEFKLTSLAKSPAKYNEEQLLYWQKEALVRLDELSFYAWVGDTIAGKIPEDKQALFFETLKANVLFPTDVKAWANALFDELHDLDAEQEKILKEAGHDYFAQAIIALDTHGADAEKIIAHLKESCGVKGKALFMPLRIALTGFSHGPDFSALFALMDVKMIKRRLERGMK